jgi:diaminopimelate decarboxylase
MNHFELQNGVLHAENVALPDIANAVGTPVYVYSRATLERHAQVFREALSGLDNPHLAFAVKANPNLAVLKVLAKQGYGADVVSGGEMDRALAAGMAPEDIVFSGVGKTAEEIAAALKAGIGQFNIESEEEGRELAILADTLSFRANAVLRINPDVDAGTHGKISTGKADNKFGVGIHRAREIYGRLNALPGLNMRGVALHIGSQLTSLEPLETAFGKVGILVQELREDGHIISHVDLGGGLGVRYKDGDNPPEPADYGAMVARITKDWGVRLMFEPGRVIAGNAGVLLTRVIRVKPGSGNLPFVIVDAAMNDLARPALYDAWHDFEAAEPNGRRVAANIRERPCHFPHRRCLWRHHGEHVQQPRAGSRSAGRW